MAAALLALACLAATTFVVLKLATGRGELPVARVADLPVGPLLLIRLADPDARHCLGIEFSGSFRAPADADRILEWKRLGFSANLEFHLVDAAPSRAGEVFSAVMPLIATADRGLYQANERGRNRVALLTELVRAGVSLRKS